MRIEQCGSEERSGDLMLRSHSALQTPHLFKHACHNRNLSPISTSFAAMKILMVCLGNICRSPLAEGILQQKAYAAGLPWSIESAGTNSYHTGEAPHPLSQKVARLNGIDITKQRARRFTAADFETYDI